jgi:hypothetical protein
VSSPQSRQRQRQRRRAQEKLWAAHKDLAERQADLVSYERVIADMDRRALPPFAGSQAIALVRACRDATLHDCEALDKRVTSLEVP